MARTLVLFLFVLFINHSCTKSKIVEEYTLNCKIDKGLNNSKVYLKAQENGLLTVLDSTTVKNGKFEFKGKVDKPVVYGIFIDNSKDVIGIFMENKTITIEAYKDSLAASKISGSKTNDDYLDYVKQSNQIISKMNVLFPAFQKARAENDSEKIEEINKKMQAINDENTMFSLNYAKQHPDSYISALALHSIINIPSVNKDTVSKIYNNFSDYVKMGDFAIKTQAFLETVKTSDSIQN